MQCIKTQVTLSLRTHFKCKDVCRQCMKVWSMAPVVYVQVSKTPGYELRKCWCIFFVYMVLSFLFLSFLYHLFKVTTKCTHFLSPYDFLSWYIDGTKPRVFDLSCLNVKVPITKEINLWNCRRCFEYLKTWSQNLFFGVLFTYIGEVAVQMYSKVYTQRKTSKLFTKRYIVFW